MNITIVYNIVTKLQNSAPEDIITDEDSLHTVRKIEVELKSLGHQVSLFEINEESVDKLLKHSTDVFFNQAFGIGNISDSEHEVAKLLEKTKVPFTGSASKAIELSNSKFNSKKIFASVNIPTPKMVSTVSGEGKKIEELTFPVIVKLSGYHCSIGLSQNSVVNSPQETVDRISKLSNTYRGPFIVEEYIEGRELNVCLLGNGENLTVLPVSEILFSDYFQGKFKIIDFAAKWLENSDEYKATLGSKCPAPLSPDTLKTINEIAKKAFNAVGCRDYARVDMRLTPKSDPYVLEVNANCAIGPDDGSSRSAKAAGYFYPQFLQKIIDSAMERYNQHQ